MTNLSEQLVWKITNVLSGDVEFTAYEPQEHNEELNIVELTFDQVPVWAQRDVLIELDLIDARAFQTTLLGQEVL